MRSVFSDIMRDTVRSVPGAVGGAFAASDGETVDAFARTTTAYQWALVTAHFGVIFSYARASSKKILNEETQYIFLRHQHMDVLIQTVEDGYYAILALQGSGQIGTAMKALDVAVEQLRKEMN